MGEGAADSSPRDDPEYNAMTHALRAARSLLADEHLQQQLRENPDEVTDKLGLPAEGGPARLLDILNAAELMRRRDGSGGAVGESPSAESEKLRAVLMEPFKNITASFVILTAMSVAVFLVGLALLGTALARSVSEPELSAGTIAIGGLGIADIVLVFYRRPWEDIARGLSNSQQARIIATSYLAGISILDRADPMALERLQQHTRAAVELLEQYTEPRASDSAGGSE